MNSKGKYRPAGYESYNIIGLPAAYFPAFMHNLAPKSHLDGHIPATVPRHPRLSAWCNVSSVCCTYTNNLNLPPQIEETFTA